MPNRPSVAGVQRRTVLRAWTHSCMDSRQTISGASSVLSSCMILCVFLRRRVTCIRGWMAVHVQIRIVRKQDTMMSQVPRFEPWATQPTIVMPWLVGVEEFREYKVLLMSLAKKKRERNKKGGRKRKGRRLRSVKGWQNIQVYLDSNHQSLMGGLINNWRDLD